MKVPCQQSVHKRKGELQTLEGRQRDTVEFEVLDLKQERGKVELKEDFIRLRAKGLSYAKIAEQIGVAKSTLANWNADLEVEIASAKAMEMEVLQEEFFLLKEKRIRLLGEQLRRLQDELSERDLSEVPTEKLLELQLRYYTSLKEEFVEVRLLSQAEQASLKALKA